MNIVEVKFDYNNTVSYFRNENLNLKNNLTVIVDSDKGLQYGKVVKIIDDTSSFEGVDLYNVVRITTKKDYLQVAYEFLQTKTGDCVSSFSLQKLMFERLGIPTIDVHKVKNHEKDSNHHSHG